MNDQTEAQIIVILQQINSRLEKIDEKLNPQRFESVVYDDPDPLLPDAVELTLKYKKASASLFERFLQIGYARASRILDQMEKVGVISEIDGAKPRKIFVDRGREFLSSRNVSSNQDETK